MANESLSIINPDQKGVLASRFGHELPVRVLSSNAGYYIGTFSESHGVVSRESVEYFPTQRAAEEAFRQGKWTQRNRP